MSAQQDELDPGGDSMIGRSIGSYRIEREIGKGGMGTVYQAVHETIGQQAAVKVMTAELSRQPRFASRFFDEARAISMVRHPGLVNIFDYNRLPDGILYILPYDCSDTWRDNFSGYDVRW